VHFKHLLEETQGPRTNAAVRQGLFCCTLFIQVQDSPFMVEHTASVRKALGSTVPIPFPEKANRTQIALLSITCDRTTSGKVRIEQQEPVQMVVTDNKERKGESDCSYDTIYTIILFATRTWMGFRPKLVLNDSEKKINDNGETLQLRL